MSDLQAKQADIITPTGGASMPSRQVAAVPCSVKGAIQLTPLEMNMLHFGSDLHTPLLNDKP